MTSRLTAKKPPACCQSVLEQFKKYGKLNNKIAEDIVTAIAETTDSAQLADTVSVHLNVKIKEKQKLLAETNVVTRLEKLFGSA